MFSISIFMHIFSDAQVSLNLASRENMARNTEKPDTFSIFSLHFFEQWKHYAKHNKVWLIPIWKLYCVNGNQSFVIFSFSERFQISEAKVQNAKTHFTGINLTSLVPVSLLRPEGVQLIFDYLGMRQTHDPDHNQASFSKQRKGNLSG